MKMQTDCQKMQTCTCWNVERSRHYEKITCKRRHERRAWHERQKGLVKFEIQPMNRINSWSRQRTLSGMHFSRMPLLAELATRNPKASRGALKCQKKYVYTVNQDNVRWILFHSVLQTQKYTRNICKAVENVK